MKHTDLILCVIASRSDVYDKFIEYYWIPFIKYIKRSNLSIEILLLFGNKNNDHLLSDIQDNVVEYENMETLVPGVLQKTILMFEHINKTYNYNKIIRTNLSTFFILENLIHQNNRLSNTDLYMGINYKHDNISFCSGACFWCSKDVIRYLIQNKNTLRYDLPDDVAIGEVLSSKIQNIGLRYDVISDSYEVLDSIKPMLSNITTDGYYNIRLKNRDRNLDTLIMKKLTNILYKDNVTIEKLYKIHETLQFQNKQELNQEIPEQLMTIKHIQKDDIVLELGGSIGRNTCIISNILNNSNNLVTIEPNPTEISKLKINRELNNFDYKIEECVLSSKPLYSKGWLTYENHIQGSVRIDNISWKELNDRYKLNFNVLVVDIEGNFVKILKDFPNILEKIRLLNIEHDFNSNDDLEYFYNTMKLNNFKMVDKYMKNDTYGPGINWSDGLNTDPIFVSVWKK